MFLLLGNHVTVMSLSYWFSHACARDSEPYVIVFSIFKSCDQTPDLEAGVYFAG